MPGVYYPIVDQNGNPTGGSFIDGPPPMLGMGPGVFRPPNPNNFGSFGPKPIYKPLPPAIQGDLDIPGVGQFPPGTTIGPGPRPGGPPTYVTPPLGPKPAVIPEGGYPIGGKPPTSGGNGLSRPPVKPGPPGGDPGWSGTEFNPNEKSFSGGDLPGMSRVDTVWTPSGGAAGAGGGGGVGRA